MSNDRYSNNPEHPLWDVPQTVLDAARAYGREAASTNDLSKEFTEEISDAFVLAIAPHVANWKRPDEPDLATIQTHLLVLLEEAGRGNRADPFMAGYNVGLKMAAQVAGIDTLTAWRAQKGELGLTTPTTETT